MTDYSELKRLLEACKESNCADASDFGRRIADLYDYLDPETVAEMVAENEALKAEVDALTKSIGAAMFLTLTEELAALRKKLTTVHFVCDRLPDQDGCRFIELENPQGESLGDKSGKWEIRSDGLAQLVVTLAHQKSRTDLQAECLKRGFEYVRESDDHYVPADLPEMADLLGMLLGVEVRTKDNDAYEEANSRLSEQVEGLINTIHAQEALRKDAERYRFLKNLPDDDYLIERLECATDPENWDSVIDAAMSKEG